MRVGSVSQWNPHPASPHAEKDSSTPLAKKSASLSPKLCPQPPPTLSPRFQLLSLADEPPSSVFVRPARSQVPPHLGEQVLCDRPPPPSLTANQIFLLAVREANPDKVQAVLERGTPPTPGALATAQLYVATMAPDSLDDVYGRDGSPSPLKKGGELSWTAQVRAVKHVLNGSFRRDPPTDNAC